MAKTEDVMKEIERAKKVIHKEDNIKLNEIMAIVEKSTGKYSSFYNGFLVGYIRGIKAKKKN